MNMKNNNNGKVKEKILMDEIAMSRALKRVAHEIVEKNRGAHNIVLIGIMNRGVPLAKRIAKFISQYEKENIPVGALDVSLYRDDLTKKGEYITVRKSDMPFSIDEKIVVLVDDVIFAGRTI